MKEITIQPQEANQRADKYVRKLLNDAPLSFIYKIFRKKDVKANGHWIDISYIIQAGDIIRVYVTDEQLTDFRKPKPIEDLTFDHEIIFEDHNILIVNKPSGLLIHGDATETRLTLANEVLNYLYLQGSYDPQAVGFMPAPAHRLDRNTSGIVVFGKSLPALQALEELFKDKSQMKKEYLALVVGDIKKDGKIDLPLRKDSESGLVSVGSILRGANSALTFYSVVEHLTPYTLLNVNIVTGRTHQIRVHMQAIGHPVIGDGKYGNFEANREFKEIYKYDSQFLHAHRLTFGKVEGVLGYLSGRAFVAELPMKEKRILESLRKKEASKTL